MSLTLTLLLLYATLCCAATLSLAAHRLSTSFVDLNHSHEDHSKPMNQRPPLVLAFLERLANDK